MKRTTQIVLRPAAGGNTPHGLQRRCLDPTRHMSVKVNAALHFRVVDPERAVINVEHCMEATGQRVKFEASTVAGRASA